jgi:glycosyltransferase involved in cell wall biosynthesis
MINNPKVSIITPSYNSARFIEKTIQSVQMQTFTSIEHIIMDGGSTDGTVDILRKYEGKYNLHWQSVPDRGQSHAFNKGIRLARGEWLYFLNSDDYLLDENSIGRVIEFMNCHPGYSIYMGKIYVVNVNGLILDKCEHTFAYPIYTHDILLNHDATVVHQGTFYQCNVFKRVGLYSERLIYHMDYEFHLRVSRFFDIYTMGFPIAALRKHIEAKSQALNSRRPIEMFWVRYCHGGDLFHKYNLYFLKGYLAASRCSRPFYEALKKLPIIQSLASLAGFSSLSLGKRHRMADGTIKKEISSQ